VYSAREYVPLTGGYTMATLVEFFLGPTSYFNDELCGGEVDGLGQKACLDEGELQVRDQRHRLNPTPLSPGPSATVDGQDTLGVDRTLQYRYGSPVGSE
jgi:hypothetical protein